MSLFCTSNSSIDYVAFYRESYLINQYFLGLFEITDVKPVLKALHRKASFLVHIIGLLFRSSSDHVYKKWDQTSPGPLSEATVLRSK